MISGWLENEQAKKLTWDGTSAVRNERAKMEFPKL